MSNDNITTNYTVTDCGSNIIITKDTYQWDGDESTLIDEVVLLSTNIDEFLPDYEEFHENWTIEKHIKEFIGFFCPELTKKEFDFVYNCLFASNMRYRAEDSFVEWTHDNLNFEMPS